MLPETEGTKESVNCIVMFCTFASRMPQRQSGNPTSRRMLDRPSSPTMDRLPPGSTRAQPATRASLMLFRLACRGWRPRRPHPCIFSTSHCMSGSSRRGRRLRHARARMLPETEGTKESVNCIVMFCTFASRMPQRQSGNPTSRRMLDRPSSPTMDRSASGEHASPCPPRGPLVYLFSSRVSWLAPPPATSLHLLRFLLHKRREQSARKRPLRHARRVCSPRPRAQRVS